jgi:hypothetical protein
MVVFIFFVSEFVGQIREDHEVEMVCFRLKPEIQAKGLLIPSGKEIGTTLKGEK